VVELLFTVLVVAALLAGAAGAGYLAFRLTREPE
jgi:hypothetical protein